MIYTINRLVNLQTLDISGDCGVGDKGLRRLTGLTYLYASNNPKIQNINHLKHLKILFAEGNCGINDDGIKELKNLVTLNSDENDKITRKLVVK